MGLLDRAIAATLPLVPKAVVGLVARRYIAGETLDTASAAIADLNRRGMCATLDVLGESVTDAAATRAATADSIAALDAIAAAKLDANLSLKLTQIGLALDPVLCRANLRGILDRARSHGLFLRLDMEDATCTTPTLDLYRELRASGYENVGIVLQAYLKRTLADIAALAPLRPRVRVCKGIYVESPEIAYKSRDEIRRNYAAACEALWRAGCHVGVATHDDWCIDAAERLIRDLAVPKDRYEFQMLLGVREDLRAQVVARGHRLRVYVPFGPHWYAYSVRRLRENPAIAGHVFRALFRFGGRGAGNGTPAPGKGTA